MAITADKAGRGSYASITALIALGQFIIATDFCVSNIALASIGHGLGAAPDVLSWVVTVFSLTYGGGLILGGRIADLFGHRAICILGLALFAAGSLLAALSPDITVLIGARAVEGLGGALLTPTTFSLINVALPEGAVRHRAYSVFGVTQGVSYILGLYLGGALVSYFGWRSCFLLNGPAIAAAMLLAWQQLPPRDALAPRPSIDFGGAILITAGMGLVMFALSALSKFGFAAPQGLAALGGGVAMLAALAVLETRIAQPLVPPAVFRYPNATGANIACAALLAGASSVFVLLPLFLQRGFHFQAVTSGLAMLPYCAAVIAGGQCAGMAMARVSLRQCIAGGVVLFVAGVAGFCFAPQTLSGFAFVMLPAMILAAFGATVASLAVMALSTGSVAPRDQGIASAVLMTCQQIGVALGVSVVFAVMTVAGAAAPDAFLGAFRAAFLTAGGFALLSLAAIFLLTRRAQR
ncbi:MAG: MFS transporter [Rhizomicrobium sp.]